MVKIFSICIRIITFLQKALQIDSKETKTTTCQGNGTVNRLGIRRQIDALMSIERNPSKSSIQIFDNLLVLNELHNLVEIERANDADFLDVFPKNKCSHLNQISACRATSIHEINADGIDDIICYVSGNYETSPDWIDLELLIECPLLQKFLDDNMKMYKKNILHILSILAPCVGTQPDPSEGFKTLQDFNQYTLQANILMMVLNIINDEPVTEYFNYMLFVVKKLHFLPVYNNRLVQLYQLNKWQLKINDIDKFNTLLVRNDVDFHGPPTNFKYVDENVPMDNVCIPNEPPIGCDCPNGCGIESECCNELANGKMPYDRNRRIKAPPGTPVYECNKRCACDANCLNRVVQRGPEMPLRIFRTSNGMGWGLQATQHIKKGQYIGEYVGEIIDNEEDKRRQVVCNKKGSTYLFDLFSNLYDTPYAIDAEKFGNLTRFINHSCEPNAAVWPVYVNCLDAKLPKICFFAKKKIQPNEEITFDYKPGTEDKGLTACLCGTKNCRKFIF